MRYRTILAAVLVAAMALSLAGCGVPKTEHEKVVKELERANQEKTTLSTELDKVKKEKEDLSKQVADLKSQISTLQKENQQLKAKLAPKKKPAKASAKKK